MEWALEKIIFNPETNSNSKLSKYEIWIALKILGVKDKMKTSPYR